MKGVITIIVICIAVSAYGQKRKLPPEGEFYIIHDCNYSRQFGKLEIIEDATLGCKKYRTDSSEMVMYSNFFLNYTNDTIQAQQRYFQQDSLVNQLFLNGFLTGDLLSKAYNAEKKEIDSNGDTTIYKSPHYKMNHIEILDIKQEEGKYKRGVVVFKIRITHDSKYKGLYPLFVLRLKSDIPFKKNNLAEYLKNANLQCLRHRGYQM